MKKRAAVFGIAVGLLWAGNAAAQSPSSAPSVDVRSVDASSFPEVSIIASISGGEVTPSTVEVSENGEDASDLTVTPLSETGQRVDVLLVLDTSSSMRGEPLDLARRAAVDFIEGISPDVELGLVTFGGKPRIRTPLTGDRDTALAALDDLDTNDRTPLFDAVIVGSNIFSEAGQHNIVLLSDGGDTNSDAKLQQAIDVAKAKGAAIFAVGLKTRDTDVTALERLAEETGGAYAPAETADLASIYQQLAGELSNQYRISYRSGEQVADQLSIVVSAFGASDNTVVLVGQGGGSTPGPSPIPAVPEGKPFFRGTWGLVVVTLLVFGGLFALLVMLLGTGSRVRRDRELRRRVSGPEQPGVEGAPAVWLPGSLTRAGSRAVEAAGFTERLDTALERSGLPVGAGEFVALSFGAAVLGGIVGGLLFRNFVLVVIAAVAGAAVPWILLSLGVSRRSSRIQAQLADVLTILASSLRAGHSFLQAIDTVSKEIGGPAGEEFNRVVAEIRLGRPVDEALNGMADRIGSDDLRWAVLAVNIQREVGGNLAEILDTVANTVRERDEIRRQVDVLTTEGKISALILTVLPIAIFAYISIVNPDYIGLLFKRTIGIVMLATGGSLLVLGVLWMRKIVKIDV
ncbi:MAG: type II secretion system F family protein [Actinomycetota bacterium]